MWICFVGFFSKLLCFYFYLFIFVIFCFFFFFCDWRSFSFWGMLLCFFCLFVLVFFLHCGPCSPSFSTGQSFKKDKMPLIRLSPSDRCPTGSISAYKSDLLKNLSSSKWAIVSKLCHVEVPQRFKKPCCPLIPSFVIWHKGCQVFFVCFCS